MTDVHGTAGEEEVGHVHSDVSGGWLRPAVFGAMDGLVTNIALVAGVGGGGASAQFIVLTGMAGLVSGAFSMALGEYASVETQNNQLRAEVDVERRELREHPKAELEELVESYVDMGLTEDTARRVAQEVHRDPELAVKVHITQELGVDPDEQPSPWLAGFSSFFCFAIGALFPLVPYLLGFDSLLAGLVVGGIGLVIAGAVVARYTARPWWLNGLRQLMFGVIAAGATYLVGALIGVSAAG
ncbi:VIT1/CCC1 family predicted Fe2+/Mn2+ transporter [Crossiella equi]|uniref:VIT1/CCC1 family predicted Fe2+/Mn2+ transporter n=1 Tax=Crossiella equi TaxID=130796 RepID=A0ABS5AJS4_9PSEU|nr:VIT1/CCC1 transporter family protein [Crossiella equi]MBP2476646.1 VIT1/CCC1 family predicted Fe2+/Mn2+ transporter [Crossiella equi]